MPKLLAIFCVIAITINCALSEASILYGVSNAGDQSRLHPLSTSTGAGTPVGLLNLGVTNITGLAFDSVTDTLFGVSSAGDQSRLFAVNSSTGAGTPVGLLNLGVISIEGLAFDSNSNTLYGMSKAGDQSQLFTFNSSTGAGTSVGLLDLGVTSIKGLAVAPSTVVPEISSLVVWFLGFTLLVSCSVVRRVGGDFRLTRAAKTQAL